MNNIHVDNQKIGYYRKLFVLFTLDHFICQSLTFSFVVTFVCSSTHSSTCMYSIDCTRLDEI